MLIKKFYRMIISGVLFSFLLASVKSDRIRPFFYDSDESDSKETSRKYGDTCTSSYYPCSFPNYRCKRGICVCNDAFILNDENECELCPVVGQSCSDQCYPEDIVKCINNVCQVCYDQSGYDVCSQSHNQFISVTQIAMAISLVLAIFATFVLLYKLCQKSDASRRINQHVNMFGLPSGTAPGDGRGSLGSGASVSTLQRYIQERLRDPPPRYSRASSRGAAVAPSAPALPVLSPAFDNPPAYDHIEGRENPTFIPDVLIPPPYCQIVDSVSDGNDSKQKEQEGVSARDLIAANERANHI